MRSIKRIKYLVFIILGVCLFLCSCDNENNHIHEYQTTVVEPTCLEDGYTIHKCECGDSYNDSYVSALGHASNGKLEIDANSHWNKCNNCNGKINIGAHKYGEWITIKEATPTTDGKKKRICSECGYESIEKVTLKTVTIKFDSMGGSAVGDVLIEQGTNVSKPLDPVKEGYVFKGWYDEFDDKYNFDNKIYEDRTIYAKWEDENLAIFNYYYNEALDELSIYSINDKNVSSIIIPEKTSEISSYAFYECENLENVYYDGTLEDWCNISFEPSSFNLMDYAKNFYILDSNGDVEYNGNKYSLVTEIEIPNTITSIGNYQFYGFNDVTSVIIPDSVTSIGVDAFSECSSLINIKIPSGVTKILSSFRGCSSLSSIIIPKSIEYISGGSFFGCSGLENVYYEGTYNDWQRIYLYEQDDSCLIEATIYYYSETMPTEDGNYWHYDENNNIVEW